MLDALTNRQQAAKAHWQRWRARRAGQGAAPVTTTPDPFAAADAENQAQQRRADLESVRRRRAAKRDNLPLMAGGLFDECRRREQDLFNRGA